MDTCQYFLDTWNFWYYLLPSPSWNILLGFHDTTLSWFSFYFPGHPFQALLWVCFASFISGMFCLGPSSLSLDTIIYSHGTNYHLYTHHFHIFPFSPGVHFSWAVCMFTPLSSGNLHSVIPGTLQTQHFQNWVTISYYSAYFPQWMVPSSVRLLKHKPESSLILASPSLSHTHSIKKPW